MNSPRTFNGKKLKIQAFFIGVFLNYFPIPVVIYSWTTASNPVFWPFDWSPKLIATSLATENWRDGKWWQLMMKKDSGGYDHFGSFQGQVNIFDNELSPYIEGLLPKVTALELNLPGLRQRRWGPQKNHHLHRTGVFIGSIKDGCAFEVGAMSGKTGLTQ